MAEEKFDNELVMSIEQMAKRQLNESQEMLTRTTSDDTVIKHHQEITAKCNRILEAIENGKATEDRRGGANSES